MSEKKPGSYDFKGFFTRPSNNTLDEYVEKVRLSLEKNLDREFTTEQALQHISIFESWNRAAYKTSLPKKPKKCSQINAPVSAFGLDKIAEDNHSIKNLREWGWYWERIKDGRVMASAADFYQGINALRFGYKLGDVKTKNEAINLMINLKKDLKKEGILLSTRVEFKVPKKNNLTTYYAQMTHRYNCIYKKEIKTLNTLTPSIKKPKNNISELGKDIFGREYLQKLFNMHDSIQELVLNLNYTTGITEDKLYIVLPLPEEQKKNPHRVIRLKISNNNFYIWHSKLDTEGYSRGFKSIYEKH